MKTADSSSWESGNRCNLFYNVIDDNTVQISFRRCCSASVWQLQPTLAQMLQ